MTKYEKGKIIKGIVSGVTQYGIFVNFNESYSGLIHISEISKGFVRNPADFVEIGDNIYVKIIDVDNVNSQLKLSIKDIEYKGKGYSKKRKIIETKNGFNTLARKLPFWIDENIKNYKNESNSFIDES